MNFKSVEENIERPETVSMTRLSRLDVCPRSFYFDIYYEGGVQTHAMARGTLFHDTAEHCTDLLIAAGEGYVPGDVARGVAQENMNESQLVLPHFEQDAVRLMAWNWGEHHSGSIDLPTLVCNETLLAVEINGWTLRGRIDRAHVNGDHCQFYDYKTSLHIPSSEALLQDFQLNFYPLLLAEGKVVNREGSVLDDKPPAAGANLFWPTLVYPRFVNEESNECVVRSPASKGELVPIKRENLHDLKQAIATSLKRLEHGLDTGDWPAADGKHCATCAAPSRCPIPGELRDFEAVSDHEQAADLVSLIERTDADQTRRKKAVKAFLQENPRVESAGGHYELKPVKTNPPSTRMTKVNS